MERSELDSTAVGTQQALLNSACIVHGALQTLNDTARACLLDILNRRLGRKNFSWIKCLSLSEEERLLLVLGGLRRRNLLFLEVGEETSFCLWGGKRRMLVVALIGKRESLLSVWDRGDSLLSVRKDRIL